MKTLGLGYLTMMGVVGPLSLVLSAALSAAVVRAVLTPEQKRWGYLRLGGDELRVIVVSIVVAIVICVAAAVAFGAVALLGAFTAHSGMNILWLLVVLLGLAAFAFVVWLSLRLSLAIPITVAERRIAVFDSFAMTKGRSLALLGMGIIAFIMAMLLSAVGAIIALPLTLATGGLQSLAALDGESNLAVLQAAAPAISAWVVLNAVFYALQLAVMSAPFAAAYRDLKGVSVDD
jgi:membrane-anchored glycerophosphoryl diester phosphodiesterase (GDPDase)